MKTEIKKFSTSFGEKKHRNKGGLPVFYFESLLRLFQPWEKCKNHRTVAIAVTKHYAKFGIKKL